MRCAPPFCYNPTMNDEATTPSILLIRLGALGDVANTLPLAAGLRQTWPDSHIAWLVEAPSRELVDCAYDANGRKLIDEVFVFPRKELSALWRKPWLWRKALKETNRFLAPIRAKAFDFSLDVQGNLKSGLLSWRSAAVGRVGFARGYCREMNWLFNNLIAKPASRKMLRAEKHAALGQMIAPEMTPARVSLKGTPGEAAQVTEFLKGLTSNRGLVVLHPGASAFGDFKRWPAERFGSLAKRLCKEQNVDCVITHGPAEAELAQSVCDQSGNTAILAPKLSLGGLIELMGRAGVFVACDTGPLHIAAIMERPVVAIFGPKDPAIYRPYGNSAKVVRKDIECSPCTKRKCDHASCIQEIEVADVFDAVAAQLPALEE
jgi:lipopolysaccharide heptosyltransferase I